MGVMIVKIVIFGVMFSNLFNRNPAEAIEFQNNNSLIISEKLNGDRHINCTEKPAGIIQCLNGDLDNINEILSKYNGKVKVSLINCKFLNGRMPAKWIYLTNIEISVLYIQNCVFNEIENNAFNTLAFENTDLIEFNTVNISQIETLTFAGLSKLTKLKISNDWINFIAKQPLDLLKNLKIFHYVGSINNNLNQINVFDFITTNFTNQINELKLSGIVIGDQFLLENSPFVNYGNLKSLILTNCKITNVTKITFTSLFDKIEFIDLSRNQIENFPIGTFTKFLEKKEFTINLTQNNWLCDCNIKHFINEYLKYTKKFKGVITCYSPPEMKYEHFSNIELNCTDTLKILCKKSDCTNCTGISNIQNGILEIKEPTIHFKIEKVSNAESKINITIETELLENLGIVVHSRNVLRKINYKCFIANKSKSIVIGNILPEISYTICAMSFDQRGIIPPFNCKSYMNHFHNYSETVPDEVNCEKTTEIIISVSAAIFSFFIGIIGMYFILRRNPTLLKNSKKVLKVNRESRSIMISEGSSKRKLSEPEPINSVDLSYSQKLKRTYSDTNIGKTENYIVPNDLYEAINYEHRYSVFY